MKKQDKKKEIKKRGESGTTQIDFGRIKVAFLNANTFKKSRPWCLEKGHLSESTAYHKDYREMFESWDRAKDELQGKKIAALYSHSRIGKELEQSLVKLSMDKLNLQEARRKRIAEINKVLEAPDEEKPQLRKLLGLHKLDEAIKLAWDSVKADLGEPTTVSQGSVFMQQNFLNLKESTKVEITLEKLQENDNNGEINKMLEYLQSLNDKAKELENMSPADRYLSEHKGKASKTSTDTSDAVFSSKKTDTDVNTDK